MSTAAANEYSWIEKGCRNRGEENKNKKKEPSFITTDQTQTQN